MFNLINGTYRILLSLHLFLHCFPNKQERTHNGYKCLTGQKPAIALFNLRLFVPLIVLVLPYNKFMDGKSKTWQHIATAET